MHLLGQISTSSTTNTPLLGEPTRVATVTAPIPKCQGPHRAPKPRSFRPSSLRCPKGPPHCAKRHCNSAVVRSQHLPSRSPTRTWRWSSPHLAIAFPKPDTGCLSKPSFHRWLATVRSPPKAACRVRLCTSCLSRTVGRKTPAARMFINPILCRGRLRSHLLTWP